MTTWFTWYIGSQHHAPTPPRPASRRRRRQHAGPPHVVVVSTPATAPTRIYTSFVFICMYIYVVEHGRPRSPMRFYVYGGAPPPSFTHVYRHIYGGVEHRHSCHTALSRALIRPSTDVVRPSVANCVRDRGARFNNAYCL